MYWGVSVLGDVSTGGCQYWGMSVLGDVSTGGCQYWGMSVLGDVSTGGCQYWGMSVLGDVSTGGCQYWGMSVLGVYFIHTSFLFNPFIDFRHLKIISENCCPCISSFFFHWKCPSRLTNTNNDDANSQV